jgi:CheY-like chemotaxis protein
VHAIPIIALTAHAFREEIQKSLAAGCSDHLTKPIRKDALLNAAQKWIKQGPQKPHQQVNALIAPAAVEEGLLMERPRSAA